MWRRFAFYVWKSWPLWNYANFVIGSGWFWIKHLTPKKKTVIEVHYNILFEYGILIYIECVYIRVFQFINQKIGVTDTILIWMGLIRQLYTFILHSVRLYSFHTQKTWNAFYLCAFFPPRHFVTQNNLCNWYKFYK